MTDRNSVVAVYDTHEQAEQAVKGLQEAGVDMKSLSIAAKDQHTDEHVVGYYNTGDRMKHWGKVGASGADSGDCFLDLRFSPYRASAQSLLLVRWWLGSWLAWRAQWSWVALGRSGEAWRVSEYRTTAFSNTSLR